MDVCIHFLSKRLTLAKTLHNELKAFCRVSSSSGQSEAFLIGGFSGTGKSRLVESITGQVDASGGFCVRRKFDHCGGGELPKERGMLEILAAFNQLCLVILNKLRDEQLVLLSGSLLSSFSSDLSVLIRLLPNAMLLLPSLKENAIGSEEWKPDFTQMNTQSVGFILRRFVRAVSR